MLAWRSERPPLPNEMASDAAEPSGGGAPGALEPFAAGSFGGAGLLGDGGMDGRGGGGLGATHAPARQTPSGGPLLHGAPSGSITGAEQAPESASHAPRRLQSLAGGGHEAVAHLLVVLYAHHWLAGVGKSASV